METKPCSFGHMLSVVGFMLQGQDLVLAMETGQPTLPETLTTLPLERVCSPLTECDMIKNGAGRF